MISFYGSSIRASLVLLVTLTLGACTSIGTRPKPIILSGSIYLEQDLRVTNRQLIIQPGASLVLAPGVGITVEHGELLALGTAQEPITITGEAGSRWREIMISNSARSQLSYVRISGADWALHIHDANIKLEKVQLFNNNGGMRFTRSQLSLRNSKLYKNKIAIRYWHCDPVIIGNDIYLNGTGIFVREGSNSPTIRYNNFAENSGYDLKLGELQSQDLDLANNFWQHPDPASKIFDKDDIDYLGKVKIEPKLVERYHE